MSYLRLDLPPVSGLARKPTLGCGPRAEEASHRHYLPDVVRRMIDSHQNGAKISLTGSVGNLPGQIDFRLVRESGQCLAVPTIVGNGLFPRPRRRWRGCRRPVVAGPGELLLVVRILAEVQKIALCYPNVLEKLP